MYLEHSHLEQGLIKHLAGHRLCHHFCLCAELQIIWVLGIIKDNLSSFSMKKYVVIPHQNRLHETVLMMGHNICFHGKVRKIISKSSCYPLIPENFLVLLNYKVNNNQFHQVKFVYFYGNVHFVKPKYFNQINESTHRKEAC